MYNIPNEVIEEHLYIHNPEDGGPIYAALIPINKENLPILDMLGFKVVFMTIPDSEPSTLFDEPKWLKHGYISMPAMTNMFRKLDGSIVVRHESCEYPFRNGDYAAIDLTNKQNPYAFVTQDTQERMWRKVINMTCSIEEFLEGLEDR